MPENTASPLSSFEQKALATLNKIQGDPAHVPQPVDFSQMTTTVVPRQNGDGLISTDEPSKEDAKADPVVEAKPVDPPKEDAVAKANEAKAIARLDQLTKREIALNKKEQELKASRAELATAQETANKLAKLKEDAGINPEALLNEVFGDDWYNKIVEYKMSSTSPADLMAKSVDAKIDRLRQEQQSAEQKRIADAKAIQDTRAAEAISNFKGEINEFITSKAADSAALISVMDQQATVFEVIDSYYMQTNKIMSIQEAVDLVEKNLMDTYLPKAASNPKIKAKLLELLSAEAPKTSDKTPAKTTTGLTSSVGGATTPKRTAPIGIFNGTREKQAMEALDRIMSQRK